VAESASRQYRTSRARTLQPLEQHRPARAVGQGEGAHAEATAGQGAAQGVAVLASEPEGHGDPGGHDGDEEPGELHGADPESLDQDQEDDARKAAGQGTDDALDRGLRADALRRGQGLVQDQDRAPIEGVAQGLIAQLRDRHHPEDDARSRAQEARGADERHAHADGDGERQQPSHEAVPSEHPAGEDRAEPQGDEGGHGPEEAEERGELGGVVRVALGDLVEGVVEDVVAEVRQRHQREDEEQVAAAQQVGVTAGAGHGARPRGRCLHQRERARDRHQEDEAEGDRARRDQQEVRRADPLHEGGDGQPGQARGQQLARADHAEEALGLTDVHDLAHQSPELEAQQDPLDLVPDGQDHGHPSLPSTSEERAQHEQHHEHEREIEREQPDEGEPRRQAQAEEAAERNGHGRPDVRVRQVPRLEIREEQGHGRGGGEQTRDADQERVEEEQRDQPGLLRPDVRKDYTGR